MSDSEPLDQWEAKLRCPRSERTSDRTDIAATPHLIDKYHDHYTATCRGCGHTREITNLDD